MQTRRYVARVEWPDGSAEQVDVDAFNAADGRKRAQAVLDADYEPGGTIVALIGPMVGFY